MKQTFLAPNYSPNSMFLRHFKKYDFPEKGMGARMKNGADCSTSLKQMQTDENFERIVLR